MKSMKTIWKEIEIRFRDIDAMGHVNNAVFFTYFEEGRKAFLEQVFGIINPSDYPFILAHVYCDYRTPLRLENKPVIEVAISFIGDKKFNFSYRILDARDPSVEFGSGESIMVFYDYEAGCSIPIPKRTVELLQDYLA